MMISPLADSSPFKRDTWRTPKTPQLEAQLLNTVPQFSMHPPPISKYELGLVPNHNAYKFLIVDDNEINLRIFRRVLKKLFPNSAIDLIQDSRKVDTTTLSSYTIVFLDIEMPHMTGIDIANAVRKDSGLNQLGLVAVTTRYTAPDLQHYEACGFDLTIPKPVHRGYSGILREIESVLAGRCAENTTSDEGVAALFRSASASDILLGVEQATASYSMSSSLGSNAMSAINEIDTDTISVTEATASSLVKPENVLMSSRAAATAAVSELLLSVSSCDSASF